MRRAIFALLLLLCSSAANAGWGLWSYDFEMQAGATREARITWVSGLSLFPAHYVFESDNPAVADVAGEFETDLKTTTHNSVTIRALAPGIAHVRAKGLSLTFATIHVIAAAPELPVVAIPGANLRVAARTDVALQVLAADGEPITCVWYEGRLPSVSTPIGDSCTHTFHAPQYLGYYFFWVRATGASGTSATEFQLQVVPPRQRRVHH